MGLLVFLRVSLRSRADPLVDFARIDLLERWRGFMARQGWATRGLEEAPHGFVVEWVATYDGLGQLGVLGCVLAAEAAWRERVPGALPDIASDSHPWEREAWSLLHQWRGAYFTEHGLHEQAVDAYRRSLDYLDSNGAIWYFLAGAREELGSERVAFQAYARAILEAPALAGPRSNLAILLARVRRDLAAP